MIKIPVITKNVIIRLSGGADSALLLWMICKEWAAQNKPLVVWPITVIHEQRHWQGYFAQQVYDWIQGEWENNELITFMPLKALFCEDPSGKAERPENANRYVEFQEDLAAEVIAEVNEVCQFFNGVTANPPEEIGQKYWGENKEFGVVWEKREMHRNWEVRSGRKLIDEDSKRKLIHCNPFNQSHKGHVAELYKRYNLLEDLLPITRSCEGWTYMTDGFTQTCGDCWWCKERDWAFNVWLQERK